MTRSEPTARDLMIASPLLVRPDDDIFAALARMRGEDLRHALVVDEAGRLIGLASNRDYRRVLERTGPDGAIHGVPQITVGEIMTPGAQLATVAPTATLVEIARLIVARRIGAVPVVDDDRRPIGIIGYRHVVGGFLAARDQDTRVSSV